MQTRFNIPICKTLMGILLIALLVLTAIPAAPVQAAPAGGSLPARPLKADGTLDLAAGFNGALDLRGWDVTLDAQRGPLFRPAENPAYAPAYSTSTWSALGTGVSGPSAQVNAIAISGSNVYVGGWFSSAGTCMSGCKNIAKWNGSTWSALGTGMDNNVSVIAISGSTIYAGGSFYSAGTCTSGCKRIAKWNGSTWSALGTGMNGEVNAIAIANGNVYAGGDFTSAGTCTSSDGCNHIAVWLPDIGGYWSALGTGVDNTVWSIAVSGIHLYAGGDFTSAGTCTSIDGCNYIARWDGLLWSAVGNGMNGPLAKIAINSGALYAGGIFTHAGTCTSGCNNIAKYSLSSDANLSDLVLSSGTLVPAFASATTTYTASVDGSVSLATVTPTQVNTGAIIQTRANGGGWVRAVSGSSSWPFGLTVGDNTVDTQVTAEDGTTTKTYTITVTRALPTPTLVSPSGQITDTTPSYVWKAVSEATLYDLKVYSLDTSTYVITQLSLASSTYCSGGTCTYTPATVLTGIDYKLRGQAILIEVQFVLLGWDMHLYSRHAPDQH